MQLTFYLFRQDVQSFEDAINARKLKGRNPFQPVRLVNIGFSGRAYVQRNRSTDPPWLPYIHSNCDPQDLGVLKNKGCSFVLLIYTSGRIFGVTMGHGYILLREDNLEQDFGLRVTMNSVGKNRIRGLQARNFGTSPIHKQMVATRETGRGAFDIDAYLDLLASLEGVVEGADLRRTKAAEAKNSKLLGTRVSGSTSCSLRHHASFANLDKKCDELWKAFDSKEYRNLFPEYDNIRLVSDAPTVLKLRQKLIDLIVAKDDSLTIALPDISIRGNIDHYRVRYPGLKAGTISEMDIGELHEWLRENQEDGKNILEAEFIGIAADDRQVTQPMPFERVAVWEGDHDTSVYAIALGRWYRLEPTYVKRQEKEFLAKLQGRVVDPPPKYLLAYPKSIATMLPPKGRKTVDREWQYNDYICKASGGKCHLMDGNFVRVDTEIEVCDIFTDDSALIHVKMGTANNTTSHLLSQGSVSARLLRESEEFRKQFRGKLPASLQKRINVTNCDPEKFTVVYALIEKTKVFPTAVSFFKKLNILHHLRILTSLNFNVRFCSIGHA